MGGPEQQQIPPGTEADMQPKPDHGETSYRGQDRLVVAANERERLVVGHDPLHFSRSIDGGQ